MQHNNEAIVEALKYFFQPGDVFEIRCLDASIPGVRYPHTESGYFNYEHIESIPAELAKIEARGVYFTPNPVNPALLARAANRIKPAGKDESTSDADILCRRWLLIDCDPCRPAKISANEEEHAAALAKAQEIRDIFTGIDWPDPVMLDSGNGAQLMYRIDLPAVDDGLIQACLKSLSTVSNKEVKIDLSVHNPARIWRLSGTWNCKGDQHEDRVYRQARIISHPETILIVPREEINQLAFPKKEAQNADANDAKNANSSHGSEANSSSGFDIESWIFQYCPEAEGPEPWKDGRRWVFPVCPFNDAHDNRSAVIIQQVSGAVAFKCHHNGCAGNTWHDLRELKEPNRYSPKNGKVNLDAILESLMEPTKGSKEKPKPWRDITDDNVYAILEGTCLGAMVKTFSQVTNPLLPLAATLPKAIVLAGCALCEKDTSNSSSLSRYIQEGVAQAKLRIDTSGGLVCNCYVMLSAPSTSGKDIGNLLDITRKRYGWKLASAGSAEGIGDALAKMNNGLITISELQNWLDQRHWQHKATTFLTEMFNKGYFNHAFSTRGKGISSRSSNYCFPSIIAHIQPDIFDLVVNKQDISGGFLGRFLFCTMSDFDGRPTKIDLEASIRDLSLRVDAFRCKRGLVQVPNDYLGELFETFKKLSHEKMHSSWKRLVNEYGPKLAVMLSIADLDCREMVVISDEVWGRTITLLQWFFAHAERMLMGVDDGNEFTKLRERLFKKIFRAIFRFMPNGARNSDISNYAGYGSTRKERDEALDELVERGIVSLKNNCYFIEEIPPGWEDSIPRKRKI